MKKTNKQTLKQLRKSYLENHNYDASRANAPRLPLKMRHFFIQMVSDSKCPHTEEFFSCLVRLEDLKLTVPMKRERLVLKWLMNTDWSRGVEALLHANRINFELFKRGKEEYALSVDKKNSREKDDVVLEDLSGTSESFPTELSIITEEKTVNQGGSTPFAKEWYGRRG